MNQAYVIGTSTKVDISSVNVDKFDDKYFSKESQKKIKKGEGEFFEADKEVCLLSFVVLIIIVLSSMSCLCLLIFTMVLPFRIKKCSPKRRRMIKRLLMLAC